jgi:hypothetical protein
MTMSKMIADAGIQEKLKVAGMMRAYKRLVVSLKLRINGYAKAFESNGLEYYVFNCRKHGKVVAYPQGYNDFLACPQCEMRSVANSSKIDEPASLSIRGVVTQK